MAGDELQIGPRANLARAQLAGHDFRGADLSEADLSGANLMRANLSGADLRRADLIRAVLSAANLGGADLGRANMGGANLGGANLREAKLRLADLSGADLRGANLRLADLTGVNLSVADLSRADLAGAEMCNADLGGANLGGADLGGADLGGVDLGLANLGGTNLSGADLRGADLGGANLSGALLGGANLRAARCFATVFANVDLRETVGLAEVDHRGPSTIGVDTLYISEGRIPAIFLRGCGLPDYLVGMVPGLTVSAPIQHFSAFISYSHADKAFARTLYDRLFHQQKVPIWLDAHEIAAGELIMKSVDRAIRRMDKVILLCSEASLNSWWVREEIERWTERERELSSKEGEAVSMVIPVDLDGYLWDCDHEYASTIRKAKVVDAKGWEDNAGLQANVSSQLHRALKLDRRSPIELMLDNPDGQLSDGNV
ncbi:MAG: toll/interleukin-1 receptor domain-containing protein [Acidimicrobiales bacterium]